MLEKQDIKIAHGQDDSKITDFHLRLENHLEENKQDKYVSMLKKRFRPDKLQQNTHHHLYDSCM